MRVYSSLFLIFVLICCKSNTDPEPISQFCDLTAVDSLNQDLVIFWYSSVTVIENNETPPSYPHCDETLYDSFPNFKYAIADALLYEKLVDSSIIKRIEISDYDIIEHCQIIPDSSATNESPFGSWQFQHIILEGDTLLPPCEINNEGLTLETTHISGGLGSCSTIFYEKWYETSSLNQCEFILVFPENEDIAEFYEAQYNLFVDVDSTHFEVRNNFLLLNNSKNKTSAVLYKK